jgi:hypothetical protein
MNIDDDLFQKVEDKTHVNKDLIISLAQKLHNGNMKDETTIREVINTLCNVTGKSINKEKEDKIVAKIIDDKVPKNIDKMF